MSPLVLAVALVVAGDIAAPEALVALPQIDLSLAVPANGATLPTNGRLIAFGQFFGVEEKPVVSFERVSADGARTALAVEERDGASLGATSYVVELGPLTPGELVTVTCSACFDVWSATVIDAVDEDAPAFGVGNKNRIGVIDMGVDVGWQVRACVPAPIDRAGGAVALRVITDVSDALAATAQGSCGLGQIEASAFAEGPPRAFCFQALAVDASGNEALFHEDICAALPPHVDEGGCANAGTNAGTTASLGLVLALLAGWRRRRARVLLSA